MYSSKDMETAEDDSIATEDDNIATEDDSIGTEDDNIVTENEGNVFFKVKVTIKESIKKLKPSVNKSKYSWLSKGMFVG